MKQCLLFSNSWIASFQVVSNFSNSDKIVIINCCFIHQILKTVLKSFVNKFVILKKLKV